jgi:hypothetical protein
MVSVSLFFVDWDCDLDWLFVAVDGCYRAFRHVVLIGEFLGGVIGIVARSAGDVVPSSEALEDVAHLTMADGNFAFWHREFHCGSILNDGFDFANYFFKQE